MPQLIHVSDLTHQVAKLYRHHFVDFLRVLVWLIVPTVLIELGPLLPLEEFAKQVIIAALTIITVVASLWLSVMVVDLIRTYSGEIVDTRKLERRSWGIWGRVIDLTLISLLQGLVVAAGFLLFLVPGLIFWCWFSFARYAVLVDGVSPGSQALKTSKELVNGRFWQIVWRWLASYLYFGIFLVLGIALLLAIIGAFLGNPGLAFTNSIFEGNAPLWWASLITNLATILATPLFIGLGVLLYQDVKRTK